MTLDGLLDWAETLLCNASKPDHATEDEWRAILKKWRDERHAFKVLNPRLVAKLDGATRSQLLSYIWHLENKNDELAERAHMLQEHVSRLRTWETKTQCPAPPSS